MLYFLSLPCNPKYVAPNTLTIFVRLFSSLKKQITNMGNNPCVRNTISTFGNVRGILLNYFELTTKF